MFNAISFLFRVNIREFQKKPLTYSFNDVMPDDVLSVIFSHLPPNCLMNCRGVCKRWMYLVDKLKCSELLWRKHCETDFPDVYADAFLNARLTWYNLYRSLTLWSKLSSATAPRDRALDRETSPEFFPAELIKGVVMLRDGIVGVHTHKSVKYYHTKDLKPANIDSVDVDFGQWLNSYYQENRQVFALLIGFHLSLHVRTHTNADGPEFKTLADITDVRLYHLCDKLIYYCTRSHDIYSCDLTSYPLKHVLIGNLREYIVSKNNDGDTLYILTYSKNIYKIENQNISLVTRLYGDILTTLQYYKLLENYTDIYRDYIEVPDIDLTMSEVIKFIREFEVTKLLIYGKVIFVGSVCGILRIYSRPRVNGNLNFFKSKPSKELTLVEMWEPIQNAFYYNILDIKVIETDKSHRVLVVMPAKIIVLDLPHETLSATN